MKILVKFIAYSFLLYFLIGCNGGVTVIENSDKYVTLVIEDCEYIYKELIGVKSLVHKGNCKNEIHKCICK